MILVLAGLQLFGDRSLLQIAWSVVGLAWLMIVSLMSTRKMVVRYEWTNQRLVHCEGMFFRRVARIEVVDIVDVSVERNLLEKILGVGSIWIRSSDLSHPTLRMCGIANVRRVSELIDDTCRQERLRRNV